MRLLLDTCTLLWLAAEPDRLSRDVVAAIDRPDTDLFFSRASLWELCLKWEAGKIRLPQPPRLWIEEQRRCWQFRDLPIEKDHLYRVPELPSHHRDPFDRLLVAQAIEESLTIATPDGWIARYPVAILW